jgi:hypothetical protein
MPEENKDALTIVISVASVTERDNFVRRIRTNLKKEPSDTFLVLQDQANRIRIYHRVSPGVKVLIRTYLIVIIPIIMNLEPITSLYGNLDFRLDETIRHLTNLTQKLQALQGRRIVKGDINGETFRELVNSLRGVDAEY